jgi:hypothetical protein
MSYEEEDTCERYSVNQAHILKSSLYSGFHLAHRKHREHGGGYMSRRRIHVTEEDTCHGGGYMSRS